MKGVRVALIPEKSGGGKQWEKVLPRIAHANERKSQRSRALENAFLKGRISADDFQQNSETPACSLGSQWASCGDFNSVSDAGGKVVLNSIPAGRYRVWFAESSVVFGQGWPTEDPFSSIIRNADGTILLPSGNIKRPDSLSPAFDLNAGDHLFFSTQTCRRTVIVIRRPQHVDGDVTLTLSERLKVDLAGTRPHSEIATRVLKSGNDVAVFSNVSPGMDIQVTGSSVNVTRDIVEVEFFVNTHEVVPGINDLGRLRARPSAFPVCTIGLDFDFDCSVNLVGSVLESSAGLSPEALMESFRFPLRKEVILKGLAESTYFRIEEAVAPANSESVISYDRDAHLLKRTCTELRIRLEILQTAQATFTVVMPDSNWSQLILWGLGKTPAQSFQLVRENLNMASTTSLTGRIPTGIKDIVVFAQGKQSGATMIKKQVHIEAGAPLELRPESVSGISLFVKTATGKPYDGPVRIRPSWWPFKKGDHSWALTLRSDLHGRVNVSGFADGEILELDGFGSIKVSPVSNGLTLYQRR